MYSCYLNIQHYNYFYSQIHSAVTVSRQFDRKLAQNGIHCNYNKTKRKYKRVTRVLSKYHSQIFVLNNTQQHEPALERRRMNIVPRCNKSVNP